MQKLGGANRHPRYKIVQLSFTKKINKSIGYCDNQPGKLSSHFLFFFLNKEGKCYVVRRIILKRLIQLYPR